MGAREDNRTSRTGRSGLSRLLRAAVVLVLATLGFGFLATRLLVVRAESAYPPLGETVRVEGSSQHVVERGSGPPVLLVHGAYGGSQDFLETIVPELSTRYRCIAWDRPGHGRSERPAGVVDPGVQARMLIALVRELALERPLLVGFSYGGAVTLAAALEQPEVFRGVVLLNGPSHPWPDPLDFQYELPTLPVVGPLAVETLLMPLGQLFAGLSVERAFSPSPVPDSFVSSPLALALRPDSYRANAEDIRTLKPFLRAQSEHYDKLTLPLVMLVSEGDLVVSPTIHSPALHAAAPRSSMVRIPDAGHQILYTHEALVIEAIDGAMRDG